MEQYKKVDLNIWVDQKEPYENLFQVGYPMDMHQDFLENRENKKHNINSHTQWFRDTIKINHAKEELSEIRKWKIVYVHFGMNIGTEMNWLRPAIIYKDNNYRFWEDVVVIPITSYEDDEIKSKDVFDVEIQSDPENGLVHKSLVKIRQIKCVSKKRLRKDKQSGEIMILWKIKDDDTKKLIDNNVRVMFGI